MLQRYGVRVAAGMAEPGLPRAAGDVRPGIHAVDEAARVSGLRTVMGYQLSRAAIPAVVVFERQVRAVLNLRPVEYTVVALIAETPAISPASLAQTLAVTPSNITAWIDRLVERDLVTRERSEVDKRAQHLHVTAQGAVLAAEATARLVNGERAAFASLSEGERTILIELLHRLATLRPLELTEPTEDGLGTARLRGPGRTW